MNEACRDLRPRPVNAEVHVRTDQLTVAAWHGHLGKEQPSDCAPCQCLMLKVVSRCRWAKLSWAAMRLPLSGLSGLSQGSVRERDLEEARGLHIAW